MPDAPPTLTRLTPLCGPRGTAVWQQLREHADAPPWSHAMGDRLEAGDLPALAAFRSKLGSVATTPDVVPLARWRETVPWVRAHAPEGRDWADIPLMSRADIALRLDELVPSDADLSRLFHYETSGTTGTILSLPSSAATVAMNHTLMLEALRRNGVTLDSRPIAHVCAQVSTWTFPAILSYLGDTGFVKVNLNPTDWPHDSARRYLAELDPQLITGDPVSLAELLAWEIPVRPRALLSGAATLGTGLARTLSEHFGCPVVDLYSSTEVGCIAATTRCDTDASAAATLGRSPCPGGMRLLCPDLYVEIVDPDGHPVPDGTPGEIVVSGGRNPYLPLLRYRTGDFAARDGEFLRDLQGRRAAWWRAPDGRIVTPIDLVRHLHGQVFAAFSFGPDADGLTLTVRPVDGAAFDAPKVKAGFEELLGRPVTIRLDPTLGTERKAPEWVSD